MVPAGVMSPLGSWARSLTPAAPGALTGPAIFSPNHYLVTLDKAKGLIND